jgi:hypothetical protein
MIFQHLDTVIAFVAVMLAASLVITAGTQLAISLLGLRGVNLRRSLADLFETASEDRDARRYSKVIARRVLRQPLISGSVFSRFGIRLDELPYMPADAAGKLRWAGCGIPLQPWLMGALGGFFIWPMTLGIVNRLFSLDFCSYSALIARYLPVLNLCQHPWRSGAILGAVFGGLLSRWRLATSIRLDELVAMLDKLSAPAGGTLPDPAQRAMLVIAGEARSRSRAKTNPMSAHMEKIFHDTPDENDGGVAVAVEKAVTQISGQMEPQVEGLNLWFERAMDRASQRFTMQARIITVVLSLALVLGTHLDALRLFRSLSFDAQQRVQLAGSADALVKQAEQLQRGREGAGAARETSRSAVPDVYRNAMVAVLESSPAVGEQPKPKSRHSSRSAAAPSLVGSQPVSSVEVAAPSEIQASTSAGQIPEDAGQTTPPAAQAAPSAPKKERKNKVAAPAESKASAKERDKSGATTGEDKATVEAKARAAKALEARPGFASREDAVIWLRATLEGDPAQENLAAEYEREVNGELVGDAEKLVDHSVSIQRELARTEFQLVPEGSRGWIPTEREVPGLLVALVFLCLGAPFCYNMLKAIASLRPAPVMKGDK